MTRRSALIRVGLPVLLGLAAADAGCSGGPAPVVRTVTVAPTTAPSPPPTSAVAARVFDPAAMGTAVRKILTETYRFADVGTVTCPSGRPVADGATFTCAVRIAGAAKQVPITVTGTDGRYRVDPPA